MTGRRKKGRAAGAPELPEPPKTARPAGQGEKPAAHDAKPAEHGAKAKGNTGAKAGKTGRRRWPRRVLVGLMVLLVLALIARIALGLALPSIVSKLAERYDLSCTFERLDLSLLAGDVELWHLVVAPLENEAPSEATEPFLDAEYCRADLAVTALLRGRIVLRRLEADGVDLSLRRDAGGTWDLMRHLEKGMRAGDESGTEAADDPEDEAEVARAEDGREEDAREHEAGEGIDLTLPIEIDALRLQHVHARIRDESLSPPLDTRVDLNVRVSDLGSPTRRTRFELTAAAAPLLDRLAIEGRGSSGGRSLEAEMSMAVRGFHPAHLESVLAPMGIRPAADNVSFDLDARVAAETAIPYGDALAAHLSLEGIKAVVDGDEALALDSLLIEARALGRGFAELSNLVVEGGRGRARRLPSGVLRAAGFEFIGAGSVPPSGNARPDETEPAVEANAAAAAEGDGSQSASSTAQQSASSTAERSTLAWILDRAVLRDVTVSLRDESVTPAADLALTLEELIALDAADDPCRPLRPIRFTTLFRAPGVADSIELTGEAVVFTPDRTFDAKLNVAGIEPLALEPYLAAAGVESLLHSGRFSCTMQAAVFPLDEGATGAEAVLRDIVLENAGELFGLDSIRIAGVAIGPRGESIGVDSVAISGARCTVRREATGALNALGFRVMAAQSSSEAAPSPTATPAAAAAPAMDEGAAQEAADRVGETANPPRLSLGRILLEKNRLRLIDEGVDPATDIVLADAGVELTDLVIDPAADRPSPVGIRAWLEAPGVAESVIASGTIVPDLRAPSLDIVVTGKGVSARAAAPYLKAAGAEPALEDGAFSFRIGADVALEENATSADLSVKDFIFTEAGSELLGADALRVDGMHLLPGGIRIEAVEIERPRAALRRDADGGLAAAGIRLVPRPAQAAGAPAEEDETAADPASPAEDTAAAGSDVSGAGAVQAPAPFTELDRIRISGAEVSWTDRALPSPVETSLTADVEVDGLVMGREADPAVFRIAARSPGTLETLAVSGTLSPDPVAPHLLADIRAAGLRAGPLAAYLPPGTRISLEDGRFAGSIEAGLAPHADGGHRAELIISGVDYRDGEDGPPLLRFDALRGLVARLDPAAGIIAIDELSLSGLETRVEKTAAMGTSVLGLELEPPAPVVEAGLPAEGSLAADDAAAGGEQGSPGEPAAAERTPAAKRTAPGRRLFRGPQKNPPSVTIEKLDLELASLSYTDRSSPEAIPISLSNLTVRNEERIELLGEDAEARPPMKLAVSGRIDPFVESIAIETRIAPFAAEPGLDVDFDVSGISGRDLAAALPDLAETIDASNLTNGRFEGHLETRLKMKRRSPLDFDLAGGFGLDLLARDVAFRNGNGDAAIANEVLLGFDELFVDVAKVEPATGDVHVRSVEITKPRGRVSREADGLHLLGLVVKLPPAAEEAEGTEDVRADGGAADGEHAGVAQAEDGSEEQTEDSGTEPSDAAASPGGVPPAEPGPEFRLDKLFVSGIDFLIEDSSAEPAMTVPLTELDVEVKNFTTRAFTEPRPIRFSVLAQSGKIPLPSRSKRSTLFGVLSDTVGLVAGSGSGDDEMEERPFFEEISLRGRVALFPELSGWVKAGVSALELGNFKGPASGAGFTLDDGVLDAGFDLRFRKDGSMDTEARITFTDVSLSEPPDGPIYRYLHLPAPLDTVLFLLRDEDGAIAVPLSFRIGAGGMSGGEIARVATETFGVLVANAIAASPFRIVGTLGDFVPLGEEEAETEEPLALSFGPGDTHLSAAERRLLDGLIERLEDEEELTVTLRHELGGGDIARIAVRANPSRGDCLDLASRLRTRKAEILRAHSETAARARAAYSAGLENDAREASRRLQDLDNELGLTEHALDRILELLRPGAERQAPRRTREACIAVGTARIEAVWRALMDSGVPGIAQRIRLTRPRFTEAEGTAGGRVMVAVGAKKE